MKNIELLKLKRKNILYIFLLSISTMLFIGFVFVPIGLFVPISISNSIYINLFLTIIIYPIWIMCCVGQIKTKIKIDKLKRQIIYEEL